MGSLRPTFVPARRVGLAVKLPCAVTLHGGLPSHLREPLCASVTFWEATAPVKLPTSHGPRSAGEDQWRRRVVFHRWLHPPREGGFLASHLSYASTPRIQWQVVVKLHGVFLSCYALAASSRPLQFHRAPGRDSAQVVMPYVRVETYPTRNFAPLVLL